MMEAPSPSETSVLTRATRNNIPEDAILYSHSRENIKSYNHTDYNNWEQLVTDNFMNPLVIWFLILSSGSFCVLSVELLHSLSFLVWNTTGTDWSLSTRCGNWTPFVVSSLYNTWLTQQKAPSVLLLAATQQQPLQQCELLLERRAYPWKRV
jgi:hypothetical protein